MKDSHASYVRASWPHRVSAGVFRGALGLLGRGGLAAAYRRAERLAERVWRLDRRWRPLAEANVRMALPERDPVALVRANYRHYGRMLAELAHLDHFLAESGWCRYEGLEHAELVARRGGVIVTAHLGNWELVGLGHTRRFGPVAALVKPIRNAYIDAWVNVRRRRIGVEPFPAEDSALRVLRHLRGGGTLVVLNDQNSLNREAVFAPFFGRLASTHYGPAMLALRARLPVITAFGIREGPGRFLIRYEPPLPEPEGADLRARTWALVAAINARIEAAVRRHPEQWFWVHRRWKNRPAPDEAAWKLPPELRAVATPVRIEGE